MLDLHPIILSNLLNLVYVLEGAVLLRLAILYINQNSVTGKDFTIHDAIDKIYAHENPLGLAILLGCALLALALIVAAFIGG